jgi:hypothetical protein
MFINKHTANVVLSASLLMLANSTYAEIPIGPYIGAQLGAGNIQQNGFSHRTMQNMTSRTVNTTNDDFNNYHASSPSQQNLAGRVFAGYHFEHIYALEVGYTRFGTANSKANINVVNSLGQVQYTSQASSQVDTRAIDITIKAAFPVAFGLFAYGKLGAAYMIERTSIKGSVQQTSTNNQTAMTPSHVSTSSIFPVVALGAGYQLSPRMVADASIMRFQKTIKSNMPTTNLVSAGLSFHFG